jgi:cytochrome c oxidase subunit 2
LAEQTPNPTPVELPDGVIPAQVIARTERRWLTIMTSMLAILLVIVVLSSALGAVHPPSNVEIVQPLTLHLDGEFAESNLGTAIEPDGSATVRIIAEQYAFVPRCVEVPANRPVRFRLTSADVVHGFLLPDTNVNTMVSPGFISEVRTKFSSVGEYAMPCHEFCGLGHHGMWAHVVVVDPSVFANRRGPTERTRCERK